MKQFIRICLSTITALLPALASGANPLSFTYQGKLLNSSGAPFTGNVDISFQILSPDGNCLLYEEKQSALNFTNTSGNFTLQVGSALSSPLRTGQDPALSMVQIFNNQPSPLRAAGATDCAPGYTPSSSDTRLLSISVIGVNGDEVFHGEQVISSSAFALSAETVQGKSPQDFILVRSDDGTALTQSNIENVFSTANFPRLLSLLSAVPQAGDGSQLTNINAGKLGMRNVASTAPAAGQVLAWNATTANWEPQTPLGGGNALPGKNSIDSAKINSAGIAVNRLLITDATSGANIVYASCSPGEILQWTTLGWSCSSISTLLGPSGVVPAAYGSTTQVAQLKVNAEGRVTGLTNINIAFPVSSVAGRTGAVVINAADISGLGTAAVQNYGTAAGNVLQLNRLGQLPAVDGSLLTNLNCAAGVGASAPTAALDLEPKTDALRLPAGTTSQRPDSPATGDIRFNLTLNHLEAYINGAWIEIGGGSGGSSAVDSGTLCGSRAVLCNGTTIYYDGSEITGETLPSQPCKGNTLSITSCNGNVITAITTISGVKGCPAGYSGIYTFTGTDHTSGLGNFILSCAHN